MMQGTGRFGIAISLKMLIVQLEGPFLKQQCADNKAYKKPHKKNKLLMSQEMVLVLKGGSSTFTQASPTPSTRYRRVREAITA